MMVTDPLKLVDKLLLSRLRESDVIVILGSLGLLYSLFAKLEERGLLIKVKLYNKF